MSSRRIISFAVAAFLAIGAFAPLSVRGDLLPAHETTIEAEAQETDSQTEPKKKGGFGRALAAPFRALARIFGGGKKRSKDTVKKSDPKSAPVALASVDKSMKADPKASKEPSVAVSAKSVPAPGKLTPTTSFSSKSSVETTAAKPVIESPTVVSNTSLPEPARIVRPAASPRPASPGMWIPVIDGIPKDPLSQGRALLNHGYLNEAISELSIAATTGTNLVEANNLLGLAYDRIGLHKTAIEAYQRALSVAPNDPVVLANLGNSHYFDSNHREALKLLKQAAKLSPTTLVIYNNLGVVQAQLGKYDDAFKSFRLASDEYDAHIKIAEILETARRDKDAARHYEIALRIQPGTALLERLVVIYERSGRQDKAESARRALGQPRNEQKTTTGGG